MPSTIFRSGTSPHAEWSTHVTPEDAGWSYSGVRAADVASHSILKVELTDDEGILVPLQGSFQVQVEGGDTFDLEGREDVFSGPTDVLYLPVGSSVTISSEHGGRLAMPTARADTAYPVQYIAKKDIPVFVRGAGPWSRRIRDFGNNTILRAQHLIAVEVITPGGNWSGIPRHKHDTPSEHESQLEEIYLFDTANTPTGEGYGFMRVSSSEAGEIDVTEEVHRGDVVVVPYGWHGPATAPPGIDLYYLNVMAGSTGREWKVTNAEEDLWVVDAWETLAPDPRTTGEENTNY